MTIPPRFIHELRDRIPLSEVVGSRVKLNRAGREHKACCPFHHEKTPSFYVNDDKQFYHCFGCGAHGSIIDFVMQHDNLSFIEAIETLAARAGMEVPQQSPQEIKKATQQKSLLHLMEEATRFFEAQLSKAEYADAQQYIGERGISENMLKSFRIGYAPADGDLIRRYLLDKGFTQEQMIEAAVLVPSKYGKTPYAFFRDRIIFPVTDRRGRVVAFGGRVLPEHIRPQTNPDYKPPKYLNSSDTPLFHKGRMLYGESHARQAAAEGQDIIVVEGYLDVMACFEAGYRGAVAPLGTALTEDQIMNLWRIIPENGNVKAPVLCFDGDNAGRRAAARACQLLLPMLKADHSAQFVFLPEGQDPDSLIKMNGRGAFEKILASKMSLVDFLWSVHTADKKFDTPEAQAGLAKALKDEIARIPDRSVQHYYDSYIKNKLFGFFRSQNKFPMHKKKGWVKTNHVNDQHRNQMLRRPNASRRNLLTHVLLATIINHPWLFDEVEEFLANMNIENQRLDSLRQSILNTLAVQEDISDFDLTAALRDAGFAVELEKLLSNAIYTHAAFVRPNTDSEKVRESWHHLERDLVRIFLNEEYEKTKKELAENPSEDTFQKFIALQQQIQINGQSSGD